MGIVRLLKPSEIGLKDEIQLFEDGLRTKEESGNYEWWYFDSKYADGSSLVIVFYTKPVTSFAKSFQPFVSLNYINPNGFELRTEVKSNDYIFSKDACEVRIGDCFIKGDLNHYEIYFKNDDAECRLTLDGSVPSWRPDSGHIYFGEKDYFAWLPSVPEGVVKGVLQTKNTQIELAGTGYHDHNWGNKLMILLMNDWYWGRAKIGDYVVVSSYIYANKKDGYKATPIFMIAKDGKIVADNASKYLHYKEKDFVKDSHGKPVLDADGSIKTEEKVYDLAKMPIREIHRVRGKQIAMIFQEPMTSLNPVFTIGQQLDEVTLLHVPGATKAMAKAKSEEMLRLVGIIPENVYGAFPHELSGGMRQRVMIAMALAAEPRLIIADEPTTALDVTIQAQILDLLQDIKNKIDGSILLITHDLGVIAEMADYVVVMYAGKVIEKGTVYEIFQDPRHPYTIGLQKSKPTMSLDDSTALYNIPGNVPNPINMPPHCYFKERCAKCTAKCSGEYPGMVQVSPTHFVACHLYDEENNNG